MFSEPDGRVERDEGDEREERESREKKRRWSEDEKRGRKKAMGSGFMNKGTDEGASRAFRSYSLVGQSREVNEPVCSCLHEQRAAKESRGAAKTMGKRESRNTEHTNHRSNPGKNTF